ncbi:MAG: hypothetical protein KDC38_01785 [Planctomycetes bacterium]|nr:hypothetical protein [Planctomycetota bacterium]
MSPAPSAVRWVVFACTISTALGATVSDGCGAARRVVFTEFCLVVESTAVAHRNAEASSIEQRSISLVVADPGNLDTAAVDQGTDASGDPALVPGDEPPWRRIEFGPPPRSSESPRCVHGLRTDRNRPLLL